MSYYCVPSSPPAKYYVDVFKIVQFTLVPPYRKAISSHLSREVLVTTNTTLNVLLTHFPL